MSTTTTNLALQKPTVGGDANVWGALLNGNADILDASLGVFGSPAATGTVLGTLSFQNPINGRLLGTITPPGNIVVTGIQSGLFYIRGSIANNEFSDLLNIQSFGGKTVISALNFGSPPTRTYSDTGGSTNLNLTGGAAGTYSIRIIALFA